MRRLLRSLWLRVIVDVCNSGSAIDSEAVSSSAVEAERGECVVARDAATALARCSRFNFTAALVNMQHRDIVGRLTMPAIRYEPMEGHLSIIARLKALLSSTRAN